MDCRCPNLGNCSKADNRVSINIPRGADVRCPECGSDLLKSGNGSKSPNVGLILVCGILLLTGISWSVYHFAKRPSSVPVAVTTPAPASPAPIASTPLPATPLPKAEPPSATVALRLHGSSAIGETLIPALIEAFLKKEHATRIEKIVGNEPGEAKIQGILPGDSAPKMIEIVPAKTGAGLSDLGAKKCDLALATRKVNVEESEQLRLAGLGDMNAKECEHIVALDALAIIVHPSNPVSELTKDQLAQIFSGQITDWNQVKKGAGGKITVCAQGDTSESAEAFKTLVMGKSSVSPTASILRDGIEVADKVCSDAGAIGFVELPAIGNAKALAISSGGAVSLLPNQFEIATEDYPLSRRLYLYTAVNSENPWVAKFVAFALSRAGQEVVETTRFVAMRPRLGTWKIPESASKEYKDLAKDAERLDLNFRFRTASSQLDNKALLDLDRVVEVLATPPFKGRYILLFGFADSTGAAQLNLTLSKARAETVAQQLRLRSISPAVVTGFGKELPVDSNDTEAGKEKNRRVEVWLRR
jgi:phosphate transport system substrate-binding protein